MKMIYQGPLSSATVGGRHVRLIDGEEVDLPDGPYVRSLIARGHLVDAKKKAAPSSATTKKTDAPAMAPKPASDQAPKSKRG